MVLFIYSGEVPALDSQLRRQLPRGGAMLVLPSSSDDVNGASEFAGEFAARSVPAQTLSRRDALRPGAVREAVLGARAVYLPGGNTYEFLAYARRIGLFDILRVLESLGGVIAAESAGSILLSPDIATAAVPTRNRDFNTPALVRCRGMGRVPFHVSPHFEPHSRHAYNDLEELQTLADGSRRAVLVLEDGQGIVMRGSDIVRKCGRVRMLSPSLREATPAQGPRASRVAPLPRPRDLPPR